jgi:hypothetical protein
MFYRHFVTEWYYLKEYDISMNREIEIKHLQVSDLCLCGLVVRIPGYRSRGPRFDSKSCQNFWVVGVEQGSLSLVSTVEELRKK